MQIRPAVEGDVAALTTLLRRSWLTVWAPELRFETVQRFAATDPARHYAKSAWKRFAVADDGGLLLGMFDVEENRLNSIHLEPKHKRLGIGSQLMDEVERRIRAYHPEATLEVRAFNTAAILFYKQRGWVARRVYQDEECGEPVETIEMVKRFAPSD